MGLRDTVMGGRKVTMIFSVGAHEAGKTLRLPVETADQYVARGYAAGSLSREYDESELAALKGNTQVVQL